MSLQTRLTRRLPQRPAEVPTGRLAGRPQRGPQPVDVPFGVRVAAAYGWRLLVIAAALALVGYVFGFFSSVLVPLLVAVLLTAALGPSVTWLDDHGLPRGVAVALVLLATVALLAGLATLVGAQVATGFADLVTQTQAGLVAVEEWLRSGPFGLPEGRLDDYLAQLRAYLSANTSTIAAGALSVTTTAGQLVTEGFLVLFALIFLLHDGRGIWLWSLRLMPAASREPLDGALRRGWVTLTQYVRATVVVAFVDAVGIGLGALVLGVPLAVPLAVLVFLGAFVPIVGALLSGAVAVLVALVTQGPLDALLLLGVVLLVQQLESNVLQPLLLGRAVSVHPLAVILAIAGGITLAGIPGALFAVPLVAVLNTVVTHLARDGDAGADEDDTGGLPEGAADAPLAPDPADEARDGDGGERPVSGPGAGGPGAATDAGAPADAEADVDR